jgi:hypothetical protein
MRCPPNEGWSKGHVLHAGLIVSSRFSPSFFRI